MSAISAVRKVSGLARRRLKKELALRRAAKAAPSFVQISSTTPQYAAALYFSDPAVNLYQARQWYGPLEALSKELPTVVIARDPESALALVSETSLPVFYGPTIADVEAFMDSQNIVEIFYVNQNTKNFQMMRFEGPAHVFICHGESEKAYMWSNQLKAYDFTFVAGQAARSRLDAHLIDYDAERRAVLVGRPQIDVAYDIPHQLNPRFKTVLYAPTWEGDRPSMRYGSVTTHGLAAIESLILSREFNVIFRPHPRSGVNVVQYGKDVERIREKLKVASATDGPSYIFDESPYWGWQWQAADLCFADVSAVAYDWMATGKPLLIATPSSSEAVMDDSPALERLPSVLTQDSSNFANTVRNILTKTINVEYSDLVKHYFGDTRPGASLERFIAACRTVARERSEAASKQPTD